jgi:hypothetical protein
MPFHQGCDVTVSGAAEQIALAMAGDVVPRRVREVIDLRCVKRFAVVCLSERL